VDSPFKKWADEKKKNRGIAGKKKDQTMMRKVNKNKVWKGDDGRKDEPETQIFVWR